VLPLKKDITKLKIMEPNKKPTYFKIDTIAIIYLVLVTFIFLSLFFASCSDDSDPLPEEEPTMAEALQTALDRGLEKYHGIGISVAVILPNGEQWAGASGISHGTVPIKTTMPFSTGSIAKNFTAAAIIKLAEEGKLNLDDSLHSWLPSYPNVDPTITIRELLNHTSGLNDIADNVDFWEGIFREPAKPWNPEDIIIAFNKEPVFPIGTDWNYSSTGYIMLRMIVEDITGSDLCSVYKDFFFDPNGLTNTYASKGELQSGTAHGWFDIDSDGSYEDFFPWPRTAFASGICGEIFSTAEDLAKWAKALYHDKSVLSQESLDQMLTFHSPCTGEEFFAAGYGLGAFKFNPDLVNGMDAIGHSGNAPGYAAASVYIPEYQVSLGFVDNTEEGNSMHLMGDFIAILIDHLEK
jgi:D-alanyl-D-alanine carboxypeptidase